MVFKKGRRETDMLSVLLNWIYIFLMSFVFGEAVIRLFFRKGGYEKEGSLTTYLVCGLSVLTIYAEYYSLISGVGLACNLWMVLAAIVLVAVRRKDYLETVRRILEDTAYWKLAVYVLMILICAFYSANGAITYDSGLYHAQSIRWIEEYGAVKGLGNLHMRFGYNSAYFSLAALFSMKFLLGQSLHAVSGFVVAVMSVYAVNGILNMKNGVLRGVKICHCGILLYTLFILLECISPSTDYISIYFFLWLITTWVELIENKQKELLPYCMLSLFAAFLVTVKLSVGFLVLLVIWPACILVKEKKWKEIGIFLGLGVAAVLPYLLRNMIVSGWFIYPSLKLFQFDWSVPYEIGRGDSIDITTYARGTIERDTINWSPARWIPVWWERMDYITQKLLKWMIFAIIAEILEFVICFFKKWKQKDEVWFAFAYLEAILLINCIVWLCSAPIVRYGFAIVIAIPVVFIAGHFGRGFRGAHLAMNLVILLMSGYMLLRPLALKSIEVVTTTRDWANEQLYFGMQKDYPHPAMCSCNNHGITIYYPEDDGGQSWYDAFPATNFESTAQNVQLRGTTIQDGFKGASDGK